MTKADSYLLRLLRRRGAGETAGTTRAGAGTTAAGPAAITRLFFFFLEEGTAAKTGAGAISTAAGAKETTRRFFFDDGGTL